MPFAEAEIRELWLRMSDRGFPPVHHSAAYTEAYRPAYRVVASEYLAE
jgi:hypothetical protein